MTARDAAEIVKDVGKAVDDFERHRLKHLKKCARGDDVVRSLEKISEDLAKLHGLQAEMREWLAVPERPPPGPWAGLGDTYLHKLSDSRGAVVERRALTEAEVWALWDD